MEKVRIGIIGCGGIATSKHMPSLAKVKNVEMVAFCDIIVEKAQKAAAKFGTPDAKYYENYKELLADETIDVVHVCTPNRSHSFITVDALEAGCHVMCEKPMAINSVEAQKMLDAAARTGKKLTIGYQNRYRPDSQLMKHLFLLTECCQQSQGAGFLLQHITGMRPESYDHTFIPAGCSSLYKLLYYKTVSDVDTVEKSGCYNHFTSSKS